MRSGPNAIAPTKKDIAREIEMRDVLSKNDIFSFGVLIAKNPICTWG